MANDDRDQRRDHAPPPAVSAQIARADRVRSGTPVNGTSIDQMAHRIKRASDQTLPDIQERVRGLESGHVKLIGDVGEVKAGIADVSGQVGILGASVSALIRSADSEAIEQAKDREAARAERAARAARAATAAEASKDRLSKRQIAAITIVPALLTALAAFIAVLLK